VSFTIGSAVTVGMALVVLLLMAYVFFRTEAGRSMRAVAENPATAALLGIRARRVAFVVFVAGTAMAALAGSLIGTFIPFSSASADVFILKAFAIAIVGGLGSPIGTLVASAIFATAETVPVAIGHANWSTSLVFLVMVVVLVIRPGGLFSRPVGHHRADHDSLSTRRPQPRDRLSAIRGISGLGVFIVFLLLLPSIVGDPTFLGLSTYGVCLVIAAYSVWIPLHFLGVASIAQAALVGVGAYAAAIALAHWDINFWLQILLACACCGVLALLLALVAMRLDSLPSVAIVTLALGGLVVSLIGNLPSLTGGVNGEVVTKPFVLFGHEYGVADSDLPSYRFGVVVVAAIMFGIWVAWRTRWGNTLLAVRDNASLAESMGFNSYLLKVAVFSLSGVLAGIAGVMYDYYSRFLEPPTFDANLSISLLLAVLLGGSASVYGPLIGVSIFVFLPYVSPLQGEADLAIYGAALIVIATFAPNGIADLLRPSRAGDLVRAFNSRRDVSATSNAVANT
jgi:branched-chain amino acid transport system permease protein